MKMLKRILSLIMALCMLASTTYVFAEYQFLTPYDYMDSVFKHDMDGFEIVYEEVEEEGPGEDISLLLELGLWYDVAVKDEELLKMKDFQVVMARLQYGAVNRLELEYLESEDNSLVTYKEALKGLIEALGYYPMCADDSDHEILEVARRIGLLRTSGIKANSYISNGDFAKIALKSLTINLCQIEKKSGGYALSIIKDKNLLNTVHDVYEFVGPVNAIHGAKVFGNGNVREGHMEIDRSDILCGERNLSDYLGKRVIAYAKYDTATDRYTLLSISEEENDSYYELDFNDVVSMSNSTIEFFNEKDEKVKINLSNIKNISVNGEPATKALSFSDFQNFDGKLLLSSTVEDGEIDTMIVWKYHYYVVGYISQVSRKIGLQFGFKDKGLTYIPVADKDVVEVVIDGQKKKWEELKPGMVIRTAISESGKYKLIHATTSSTVVEKVMERNVDTVRLADDTYRISKDLAKQMKERPETMVDFVVGAKGSCYVFGDIIVTYSPIVEYKYAYLRDVAFGQNTLDQNVKFKMFTQYNDWEILELADKVEFDGKRMTKEKAMEIIKADTSILNTVVRYNTNMMGNISFLDTINTTSEEHDDKQRMVFLEENPQDITIDWTYSFLGASVKYRINDGTVVFKIPSDLTDEKYYEAIKNTEIPNSPQYTYYKADLYSPDDFNTVKVLVWKDYDAVDTSTPNFDNFLHVEEVMRAVREVDGEQEFVYVLEGMLYKDLRSTGLGSCSEYSVYVTKEDIDRYNIKAGSFIGVQISRGTLANAKLYSEDCNLANAMDKFEDYGNYGHCIIGTIKSIDSIGHQILVEYTVDGVTNEYLTCPRAMGVINTRKNITIPAVIDDFTVGDRVCFLGNYGHASWMFKNLD